MAKGIEVIGLNDVILNIGSLRTPSWLVSELNKTSKEYMKQLKREIHANYTVHGISGNLDLVMSLTKARKKGLSYVEAKINIQYLPVKLNSFDTKRTYQGGSIYKTEVRVIRGVGWALVNGRFGHKGFLQPTHKKLFERREKATWRAGKRTPIIALYGLSVTQMATSKRVQEAMKNKEYGKSIRRRAFERINKIFGR